MRRSSNLHIKTYCLRPRSRPLWPLPRFYPTGRWVPNSIDIVRRRDWRHRHRSWRAMQMSRGVPASEPPPSCWYDAAPATDVATPSPRRPQRVGNHMGVLHNGRGVLWRLRRLRGSLEWPHTLGDGHCDVVVNSVSINALLRF